MTSKFERRLVTTEFEVRAEGKNLSFYGYALTWEKKSQNLGGFREKVQEGATTKTIGEADVRALFNHDPSLILGRNKSNTLRMSEDSTGLHYEVDMPDTSYARDLAVSMQRGDVTQSSFGFRTIQDDWGIDEDDFPIRTLQEIALLDVSPVTYPAYLDSTSGVNGKRALERLAESRGLSLDSGFDLRAAITGEKQEPEAIEPTTLVIPSFRELPDDPALALRVLRGR